MVRVTVLPPREAVVSVLAVMPVAVRIETPVIRSDTHSYYDGSYTVTPRSTAQILPTADKIMRNDLTVFKIPYWEVGNLNGTTVYIGESNIHGN